MAPAPLRGERSSASPRRRGLGGSCVFACLLVLIPVTASAQPMGITLSRLRFRADSPRAVDAPEGACLGGEYCGDFDAYHALMSELGGALAPPVTHPAATVGQSRFYVGLESSTASLSSDRDYWRLGTRGGQTATLDGGNDDVSGTLSHFRLVFRKGLPFGLQVGATVGRAARTGLWVWGIELQWALFEGFDDGVLGYLPDVAIRGAIHTITGDPDFILTVPTVDLVISKDIRLARGFRLTPMVASQVAFIIATTEAIDVTPNAPGVGMGPDGAGCDPVPPSPTHPFGGCLGAGANTDNIRFPRVQSARWRMALALAASYQTVTVRVGAHFDLLPAHRLDANVPADVPRTWSVQTGVGFTY